MNPHTPKDDGPKSSFSNYLLNICLIFLHV